VIGNPEERKSRLSHFSEWKKPAPFAVYTTVFDGTSSVEAFVGVQTPTPVPTTMVTEYLMVTVTKGAVPVPTGPVEEPCFGLDCGMPPIDCLFLGCGEPPCMGDDCFDDGLPLPPALVPMPEPRPFPVPGHPLPPRPILCDSPGCELPGEDLRCLDLLDCQPPIDEPACMTTDCGTRRKDEHLPKDPVHDAGTGPMDAQQE